MTKDEALKMAIEWIEGWYGDNRSRYAVLNACKEALEQPKPPEKTTSLEDVIKEFEKDPEMKALLDLARKQVRGMELKQPAQEPNCYGDGNVYRGLRSEDSKVKTYHVNTHPHQWQELTDDEIVAKVFENDDLLARILLLDVASKALKQALKEMNT